MTFRYTAAFPFAFYGLVTLQSSQHYSIQNHFSLLGRVSHKVPQLIPVFFHSLPTLPLVNEQLSPSWNSGNGRNHRNALLRCPARFQPTCPLSVMRLQALGIWVSFISATNLEWMPTACQTFYRQRLQKETDSDLAFIAFIFQGQQIENKHNVEISHGSGECSVAQDDKRWDKEWWGLGRGDFSFCWQVGKAALTGFPVNWNLHDKVPDQALTCLHIYYWQVPKTLSLIFFFSKLRNIATFIKLWRAMK